MTSPVVTYVDLEDIAKNPPKGFRYMSYSYNAQNNLPYTLTFGVNLSCQFGKETEVSIHKFRFHVHCGNNGDGTIDWVFGGLWQTGYRGDHLVGQELDEEGDYGRLKSLVDDLLPDAFEVAEEHHQQPPPPPLPAAAPAQKTYVGPEWQ